MSLLDIVKEQKKRTEEQLSRGGTFSRLSFWRPENGDNKIRIMPQWNDDLKGRFWREVSQHWNVSEDMKGPVLCPKNTPDLEGECPICDLVKVLSLDKSNTDGVKFAKDIRAKKTYFLNVIVNKDPEYTAEDVAEFKQNRPDDDCPFEVGDPKIQIYAAPITVFDAVLGLITTNEQDITDLYNGRDLTIRKIPHKDRIKTQYQVVPSLKERDTGLSDLKIPDLNEVGRTMSTDEMVTLLASGKALELAPSLSSGSSNALPKENSSSPSSGGAEGDLAKRMQEALNG